jgi:hypothetical protein
MRQHELAARRRLSPLEEGRDVMGESAAIAEPQRATPAVRGQLHKFLPLPVMPQHAQWFDAGPVSFAVEARVLDDARGDYGERSASIHVFGADRREEYLRFDCFVRFPHYHYVLNDEQHNIVWGYDPDANGPMLAWSLTTIRERLAVMLRHAHAAELAERVEEEGFDVSVVERIKQAIDTWEPSLPPDQLMEEARAWYARWKKIHPQFNTAD